MGRIKVTREMLERSRKSPPERVVIKGKGSLGQGVGVGRIVIPGENAAQRGVRGPIIIRSPCDGLGRTRR